MSPRFKQALLALTILGGFAGQAEAQVCANGAALGSSGCPFSTTPSVSTTFKVTDIPTIQNAAYALGNCVGGFRSVTLTTNTGVSGLLQAMKISSISGGTESLVLYAFSSNPSGSTCSDKGTFTLANADVDKIIGVPTALTLTTVTGSTATYAFSGANVVPFTEGDSIASGVSTIYYGMVAGGTFTSPTVSDLHVSFGVVMDRP